MYAAMQHYTGFADQQCSYQMDVMTWFRHQYIHCKLRWLTVPPKKAMSWQPLGGELET